MFFPLLSYIYVIHVMYRSGHENVVEIGIDTQNKNFKDKS